ncbi:MAG: Flp pilus assembly complex ATPase component TadA, partial [Thermoplasmata archaeon]|nr:Flp pilus assembly complex ATPase component TadA [Thermoplasmata archaeon]
RPQTSRTSGRLADADFDLVAQTLPTSHGTSATIKLINRSTFIKDFTSVGLEIEDRVRLLEELRASFGFILVTAPVFSGAGTTLYSIMNFLVQAQRDVVSLEAPVHWPLEGVRQVEVESDAKGLKMEETLRSVVAVRPEVIVLSSIPDKATGLLATQLASSVLVVAVVTGQTAGQGVTALLEMGVPPQLLAGSLAAATCQRLVRQICTICREPAEAPAPQTLAHHGIGAEESAKLKFFRGKGCPSCNKVGYRGRRAIFEVMSGVPEVRSAIQNAFPHAEIESLAVGAGMKTLRERCLALVTQGITTFDEFAKLRL